MAASATSHEAYRKVDVETASQGRLIVLLFNGALQRAEEAKRELDKGNIEGVHNNLVRAQDILAELRGALNMEAGEVARNLDRAYEYFHHLLIQANIRKDVAPLDECINMMTEMRDAWESLFSSLAKDDRPDRAPMLNQHGSAVINVQG